MRSNRSAFKLEALEQRQLLATIVGGTGGTEVGSNITVAGKVYDQILMTGSSLSVQADAGQIVRVDFLDADGDITRAEFSGTGTMSISLANFVDAASPSKYTISGTKYVSGLASITITGSDATSNFNSYSLGTGNAFLGAANPIFSDPTKQGGNHLANEARLVIVGDPTNLVSGPGSAFSNILAGNVVFGDSSGVIGLYAPNTSIKAGASIIIGDIVPSGTATPTIQINGFSDVKTVTVAGGSLAGSGYVFSGFNRMVLAPGTDSSGTRIDTKTLANSSGTVTYTSGLGTVTIDASTATQATLDAYKASYLTDVVINGSLASGMVFKAFQFGNVTINGNLAGVLTTDTNDDNSSGGSEQGIGNVTINGNIVEGGYIESSTSIGNVTVTGTTTHAAISPLVTLGGIPTANYLAVISTLGRGGISAAIGNVSFGGDVNLTAAEGLIVSGLKSVSTAQITSTTTAGATTGGIGNISGVNLTANTGTAAIPVIGNFATGSNIGNITFSGDVSLTNNDASAISSNTATTATGSDLIYSSRGIGNITAKSLSLTDIGNAIRATNANSTSLSVGTIGNISTTAGALTLVKGGVNSNNSIGNISATGGNLALGTTAAANITAGGTIGNISVTSGNLTNVNSTILSGTATNPGGIGDITVTTGDLTVSSAIQATGGNIGNITLTSTGTSAINALVKANVSNNLGGSIGNLTVTAGNLSFGAAGSLTATANVGNVTLGAGTLTFAAGGKVSATAGSIGNISVGGRIAGADNNIEFTANSIGNVSVTGRLADADLLANVNFQAKGTTAALIGTAKIGDITLNSSANSTGDIASGAAAVDADSGVTFSSSGNIGNITLTTGSGTGAEIVTGGTGGLLFRAGSSEGGAVAAAGTSLAASGSASSATYLTAQAQVTTDAVESVSIGNVSITANVSDGSNLSTGNGAGKGLIISSGVTPLTAGAFRVAAQNAAVALPATVALQTAGTIGNVTISDVTGNIVRTPFSNANLNEANVAADNGGSIIIADKIASITVNSGPGSILSLPSLSGLPLKGAIGDNAFIPSTSTQAYSGSGAAAGNDGLVIVVL